MMKKHLYFDKTDILFAFFSNSFPWNFFQPQQAKTYISVKIISCLQNFGQTVQIAFYLPISTYKYKIPFWKTFQACRYLQNCLKIIFNAK